MSSKGNLFAVVLRNSVGIPSGYPSRLGWYIFDIFADDGQAELCAKELRLNHPESADHIKVLRVDELICDS